MNPDEANGSVWYFSGTGNSRAVARRLADSLRLPVHPVGEYDGRTLRGSVGIVAPVYAWGIPGPAADFARRLSVADGADVWCVLTCGDDTGRAPEVLGRILRCRGITLRGVWSVQMPNIYVLLPGFDVDSPDVELEKLRRSAPRVDEIAAAIRAGQWTVDVVRGTMPRLKTALVYPLFRRFGVRPRMWRVSDACISCGRCADACPQHNIRMTHARPAKAAPEHTHARPVWGDDCSGCLACYHICPRHAIAYGTATLRKGQYRTLLTT